MPKLETFPNPGVRTVELVSDELTAICPLTHQPDLYTASIRYQPDATCLETRSLKLYLNAFRNEEHFCEALATRIRDDIATTLQLSAAKVEVTLTQKARGGITITASAERGEPWLCVSRHLHATSATPCSSGRRTCPRRPRRTARTFAYA
jgi:7-cyano-7-deazaguanine reductase